MRAFGVLPMVPLDIIVNQRTLNVSRQPVVPLVETLVPRSNGTVGKLNGQQLYTQKKKFSQYFCFLTKSTILKIALANSIH